MMQMPSEKEDRNLDRLLAAYKDACGSPDASVNFMPEVWNRIESRKGANLSFRRLAQAFVAASAAACLLLFGLSISPWADRGLPSVTYVEALDHADDSDVFVDVALSDRPKSSAPAFQAVPVQ